MIFKKTLFLLVIGLCLCMSPAQAEETGHKRVIALKGTQNTRDIGGYETTDGRQVRWGAIFRSDKLSRLLKGDFQRLEKMGLRTIIDLRTPEEAKNSPTVWKGENPPRIVNYPVGQDDGQWFTDQDRMWASARFNAEDALNHFVEGYRVLPETGLESYRRLVALVLDESNWPLLIHCSAGKDRSGIAIALILEAVGVKREIIMEDYLLTNKVARTREQAKILSKEQDIRSKSAGSRIGRSRVPSEEAYFPFVGVMPEMLNSFYQGVDEEYGSLVQYLERLGLDQVAREAFALSLTEQPEVQ
jgi:protein-tyrosine phosphatase